MNFFSISVFFKTVVNYKEHLCKKKIGKTLIFLNQDGYFHTHHELFGRHFLPGVH